MTFSEMGLAPEILRAIREAGYEQPTPIQEKSIPVLLQGRDIMGCAQTGTGKTAAFALPILHRLGKRVPGKSLRAVILVPTRELAIQVAETIRAYGQYLDLRTTAVYGGVPIAPQEKALHEGVDVLVATPGRLFDHMWRANIDYRDTEVLVLDEADRMLDMGFYDDVMAIVNEIPSDRQSMLFSATLSPEIRNLSRGILRDPVSVEAAPPSTTVEEVEQIVVRVENGSRKREVLDALIRKHRMDRALIFTKTKRGASALSSFLKSRGYRTTSIHSDKTQEARVAALEGFREGRIHILVATDIAARGLDVDGIGHVVNFDVPHTPDDYVHRIGRTARAGRKGIAISLVSPLERKSFEAIERRIGGFAKAAQAAPEAPVAIAPPAPERETQAASIRNRRRRRKPVSATGTAGLGESPSSNGAHAASRPSTPVLNIKVSGNGNGRRDPRDAQPPARSAPPPARRNPLPTRSVPPPARITPPPARSVPTAASREPLLSRVVSRFRSLIVPSTPS